MISWNQRSLSASIQRTCSKMVIRLNVTWDCHTVPLPCEAGVLVGVTSPSITEGVLPWSSLTGPGRFGWKQDSCALVMMATSEVMCFLWDWWWFTVSSSFKGWIQTGWFRWGRWCSTNVSVVPHNDDEEEEDEASLSALRCLQSAPDGSSRAHWKTRKFLKHFFLKEPTWLTRITWLILFLFNIRTRIRFVPR